MYLEEFRRQEFEYPLVVGPPVVDANKGQIAVILHFLFPQELEAFLGSSADLWPQGKFPVNC